MKLSNIFILLIGLLITSVINSQEKDDLINRYDLVNRHNPVNDKIDPWSPFTVGNGGFALTADITGLQTFPELYHNNGIPLQIISDWCWHTFPNPKKYSLQDAYKTYDVHGRKVEFPSDQKSEAGKWLRKNPQRQPLGQIGFEFTKSDGSIVNIDDIKHVNQKLHIWQGLIESNFWIEENEVDVVTVCNPNEDVISVKVKSNLISEGKIFIKINFPYSYVDSIKNNPPYNWNHSDSHQSEIIKRNNNSVLIERTIDSSIDTSINGKYYVYSNWSENGKLENVDKHFYKLIPDRKSKEFKFSIGFFKQKISNNISNFDATLEHSKIHWENFWNTGGAIDFSGSTDPRANEIERRIILSEYLTAIQFAGNFPPQETGLTLSSWFGKHNTEMIWWHAAHFALWNRVYLLEKNLNWYIETLPFAKSTAKQQGFKGARWSKMVDQEGRETPGNNPFIIWNQPHPIYLAELCYIAKNDRQTLENYKDLVFQTAEYLASYAYFDTVKNYYVLGPPIWTAQEIYDPVESQNPSFELAYWKYGLETAQKWRERLDLERIKAWDEIITNISPLPVKDSLYVVLGSIPDTFTNPECEIDHPSMLMSLGFLNSDMVDKKIMKRTLNRVVNTWNWEGKIWGWDYPMIAMTAARLDEPELAVDILLKNGPNNRYLNNGHCPQRTDLPVYLPANGALLSAVALMVADSDDTKSNQFLGFPNNGEWKVKFENINRFP